MRISPSLTRTTLYRIAAGVTVIVALSSAISYYLVFREIERGVHLRLQVYTAQRAEYHESYFSLAKEFEEVIARELLRRYHEPSVDYEQRFERLMMRYPDGAMRNRPEYSDVLRYSTGWIHKDIQPDAEFKRIWMLFFDLSEKFARLVTTRFMNLWFAGRSPDANMGFDRQTDPDHPILWAANTPADYPAHDFEVYNMADEAHNPQRATVWSAPFFEPAYQKFEVGITTPIYVDDRRIATIGISIDVDDLEASVLHSDITGASHSVFRTDGLLIVDAVHKPGVKQDHRGISIADTSSTDLVALLRVATERDDGSPESEQAVGYEPSADFYYAISYLPTPNWYFASTLPGAMVRAQAFRSVQWVFWTGIASLGLLLMVLTFILRRQIAHPLNRLLDAIRAVGTGGAPLVDPRIFGNPGDEIGRLAGAFNEMVAKVSERDLELRVEKERFRALIEHAADVISVVDSDGVIDYVSPSVETALGFPPDHYIGKSIFELVNPDDAGTVAQAFRAALSSPRLPIERTEYRLWHARGEWRVFEATGTNQLDNPSVLGLVVNARDISEVKEAESEIARQRESLYQREKLAAMGSLLAGVAHELNNPLAIVVGRAIMLEDAAETETTLSAARKIRSAAERCARIVKTFLAMARQHKPQQTQVQCNRVLEDSLDMLGYSLRTHGIEVSKCLTPDLPDISADADQLHQVFINLIVNAQQALSEQPEPRRLHLSSRTDPAAQEIHVEVADNGPGIPEAVRSRIFDPYFTTKPIGSGTGVGLAVSLGIVEAHGGSLTVSCPPEGGAVFAVRLKVQDAINPAFGTEAAPLDQPHTRPSRILIVDDEPEVAALLKDILVNQQRAIDTAGSGREALRLLAETGHYDAILSDLRMPDLDGPALFREIQGRWPELAARVLFVTGDTLNPNLGAFLETCQCPLIEKPFVPADVRQKVAQLEKAGYPVR